MTTAHLLPPTLRDHRSQAFAAALDKTQQINPWQACPNALEHTPDEVLWELAREYDVAGPLWQAMRTRAQKERLVSMAPRLQRKRGTRWSVEEVMRLLGYADAKVLDRTTILIYDGQAHHNGAYSFNSGTLEWNEYKIRLCIDSTSTPFTDSERERFTILASDWAPLRSTLTGWEARHTGIQKVTNPAQTAVAITKVVIQATDNTTQTLTNFWTQKQENGTYQLRWRVPFEALTLPDIIRVTIQRSNGNDMSYTFPQVTMAPNVVYEGAIILEAL